MSEKNKIKVIKITPNIKKKVSHSKTKNIKIKSDKNNNIKSDENLIINDKNNINLGISVHPKINNYLLNDIQYIKSTTIKEILKILNLNGDKFKELESYLNKEIKIK